MDDDRIKHLLKHADELAATNTPAAPDLGPRVRRRARRRRIARHCTSAAAAVLLLAGGLWIGLGGGDPVPAPQVVHQDRETQLQRLEAEAARFALDAEIHSHIAEALWAAETHRQRQRAAAEILARPDVLERLAQQREQATLILVDHADRLWREHNLKEQALREYHNAAQLFPDTHWAGVARERLKELENGKAG